MISKDGRKPGSEVGPGQLLTLEHLRKFVVVAEELSFTRASRRLHVVQSAVSSAIQGLEREVGALLFDRDRHRVALTDAGHALLPEARATLAASLVRNGLGIAFIPQSAADLTGLGVIGLDGPALRWRVSLATPTARRLSAAARAFAAELLP